MLNELNEYLSILIEYKKTGKIVDKPILHQHLLWLLDINGHLEAIKNELDSVEGLLKKFVSDKKHIMHKLHYKALEFITYVNSGITTFPSFEKLTSTSIAETTLYLNLLIEIADGRKSKEILGIIDPELLDHMFREQAYYLIKLGGNIQGIDPTTPQIVFT